jgi:hypothetical protein
MVLTTLLLLASLATAPGADEGVAETAAERAGRAYTRGLLADIRASGSPRERALFARVDPDASADAMTTLRAAALAAPADAVVQMFMSGIGGDASAWSRVEPDNGLAWIPLMEGLPRDGKDTDAAIARIAEAPGYDDHFVETWLAFRNAIAARPMPRAMAVSSGQGDVRNATNIMAMAYAAALPVQFTSLSRACDQSRLPKPSTARLEACAHIGRGIMASEGSVMTKRLGAMLVRVSGLQGDADRAARRSLDWLLQASWELLDEGTHPGELNAYFADLAATSSETRAIELLLARHGRPIEPPADWAGGR